MTTGHVQTNKSRLVAGCDRRSHEAVEGRYIVLPGGPTLPVAPWLLALDLERRGVRLWREGSDILIEPFNELTANEVQQLRRWKAHVLALLAYAAPELTQ